MKIKYLKIGQRVQVKADSKSHFPILGASMKIKYLKIGQRVQVKADSKSHFQNCYTIMMALGANSGSKLKELEGLMSDFGIDLDNANTKYLADNIPEKDAQDIVDWIKKHNLRVATK